MAGGVVFACLLLRAERLSTAAALSAAAVGVPSVMLAVVVAGHLLGGPHLDTSARVSGNPLVWVAAGVQVVLALLAVAALQRRRRSLPGPLVGSVLVLLSVVVTTIVLMPQLLPAYRGARGGGPYPSGGLGVDTWLPAMVAPLVLSILVVGGTALLVGPRSER
jgi:cytochrome bd-type quinol oxidase subunit 2